MLLFYINASTSAADAPSPITTPTSASTADAKTITLLFTISKQEDPIKIKGTVSQDSATAFSQFLKDFLDFDANELLWGSDANELLWGSDASKEISIKKEIPIKVDITASSNAHQRIVESVMIPLLNGSAPTIDLNAISGEEAAVLIEYLEHLNIDSHQEFGPIKWVENFSRTGVEVYDPKWTIEFLKHTNKHRRLSISPKASKDFLKELTTHTEFEKIEQGYYLSLSLGNRVWDNQAEALQKLNEHFAIYDLVNVVADQKTVNLLSGMVYLNRLGIRCTGREAVDELVSALDILAKKQLINQSHSIAWPQLQRLDLWLELGNNADAALIKLAPVIAQFHQLTHLTVWGNYEDAGAIALAEALKTLKQLTHLEVKGCYGDAGATALAPVLQYLPLLTHLEIKGWYKDAGATALAPVLQYLPLLTHLNVWGDYGDEGATALAPVLQSLTLLTHLEITGWYKDAGVKALAKALQSLTRLTHLNAKGLYRDAGVKELAEALQSFLWLTHLEVEGWYGNAGAIILAKVLKSLTRLTHLTVWGEYGDAGVKALAEALQSLTLLTHLAVEGRRYGDEGAIALAKAIHSLPLLPRMQEERLSMMRKNIKVLCIGMDGAHDPGKDAPIIKST